MIALGMGIGVDYELDILSGMLVHMRAGFTLSEGYCRSLLVTGRVVTLKGATPCVGVLTWIASLVRLLLVLVLRGSAEATMTMR